MDRFDTVQQESIALVERLKARDKNAWVDMVAAHSEYLHGYLRHHLPNANDLDDLVQESFIRAWDRIHTNIEPQFFRSWLTRLAINLAISFKRRRSYGAICVPPEFFAARIDSSSEPEAKNYLDSDLCRRCLHKLSPEHRTMLRAKFWRDLSYEQIAEELHLQVGTVRSRLNRALNDLFDVYFRTLEEEGTYVLTELYG